MLIGDTMTEYVGMNLPQPLDLGDILETVLSKERLKEKMVDRITVPKSAVLDAIELTKDEIRRRIRRACIFFLKYRFNHTSFEKDFPEFKEEIKRLRWVRNPYFEACKKEWFKKEYGDGIECDNCPREIKKECQQGEFLGNETFYDDYNDWLFKLAFKDVLQEG